MEKEVGCKKIKNYFIFTWHGEIKCVIWPPILQKTACELKMRAQKTLLDL